MLIISAAIYAYLVKTRPSPEQINIKQPTLNVIVYPVKCENIQEKIIGYGTARALRTSNITAQVAGTIIYRNKLAYAGEKISKGQILFKLDERDYRSKVIQFTQQVESTKAQIEQIKVNEENYQRLINITEIRKRIAQDEYKRVLNLFERNLAPKRELDLADQALQRALEAVQKYKFQLATTRIKKKILQSNLAAVQSKLEIAKINLDRCTIKAPFTGQIVKINADIGQTLNPGFIVAIIIDPSKIEVPVELPASKRSKIKLSANAKIVPEVRQPGNWKGKISRIDALIDTASRTFRAFVLIDEPIKNVPLVPGAFVIVTIDGPLHKSVIAIPRTAIKDNYVFIAKDGKAHKKIVKIAEIIGEQAIISEGLKPKDLLIISNMDVLYEGAPIKITSKSNK